MIIGNVEEARTWHLLLIRGKPRGLLSEPGRCRWTENLGPSVLKGSLLAELQNSMLCVSNVKVVIWGEAGPTVCPYTYIPV